MSNLMTHWYSGGRNPTYRTPMLQDIAAEAVAKRIKMQMITDVDDANDVTLATHVRDSTLYHHVMTDPELAQAMMEARNRTMHRSRYNQERWEDDGWWHGELQHVLDKAAYDVGSRRAEMADFNRVGNMMSNNGVRNKYARGATPYKKHSPLLRLATPTERLSLAADSNVTEDFQRFVAHELGIPSNSIAYSGFDCTVLGLTDAISQHFPRFDHETAYIIVTQLFQEYKRLHPSA